MRVGLAVAAVLVVSAVLAPSAMAARDTWTVVAVDRAGNSSGPSNAVTLTVVADQNLC